MKVFIPVSDAILGTAGELGGQLVPFQPDFLPASTTSGRSKEGYKPANWISDSDYASACERLRQSAASTPN